MPVAPKRGKMYENLFKIVDLVQRSTEFVDKGWGYFSTVTLACVALMFGSDRARLSKQLRIIVALGYSVFAIGNCLAIVRAQKGATRWKSMFNLELSKINPPLPLEPMNPFPVWQLVLLHAILSVFVVVVILLSHRVKIHTPD